MPILSSIKTHFGSPKVHYDPLWAFCVRHTGINRVQVWVAFPKRLRVAIIQPRVVVPIRLVDTVALRR